MNVIYKLCVAAWAAVGIVGAACAGQPSVVGDMVQIGCTLPPSGTEGSTVYSLDNLNAAGVQINLPASVTTGASCTQALNSMLTAASSPTCAAFQGYWAVVPSAPSSVTISATGYALNYYVLQCIAM